jgi:hypothetical protein
MQVTTGYSWERMCHAAENEPNPIKLRALIRDAEQILSRRSREVRASATGEDEGRAIRGASSRLRFIATERLEPADK